MDFQVSKSDLYSVADILGMTVELDYATGKLSGKAERVMPLGELSLPLKPKIAGSLLLPDCVFAAVNVLGNLALLVVISDSGPHGCTVHVLNLAKMDQLDTWLDKKKPKTRAEALELLGSAVVKSYRRVNTTKWEPL